jgi:putative addiction module CopG family antidote
MPTRNVVLTERQQQLIDSLVRSGRYQNASEVLREGIRMIERREADGDNPPRTARLEARITADVQALVRRAANLEGRTVSDFIVTAAVDAATRTITQMQVIRLSGEDALAFARAMIDPAKPSAGLRKSFERHRDLIGE